jgi:hypothetical protein
MYMECEIYTYSTFPIYEVRHDIYIYIYIESTKQTRNVRDKYKKNETYTLSTKNIQQISMHDSQGHRDKNYKSTLAREVNNFW